MGNNRRYGSDLTDAAVAASLVRPQPISLTRREAGDAVREAPTPIAVTAWVRFPETPVEITGRALAWTDRAVLVEFELPGGARHQTWVWASAVTRRDTRHH